MHDGGRGRVLMFGRERELLVKTEWKEVLNSLALVSSVRGCTYALEEYRRGYSAFLA